MAKKDTRNIIEKIHDLSLEDIMGDGFARYSKEIIQERALPDVRDGLKPVQRRIIYSMYEKHYTFDKPHRKCATAVGDIMGRYHPHGDSSIYDALVRMSQEWKMRAPFIDIHGNNGSIDGDGAAAMRYTECRLTKLANIMVRDINKNTVKMAMNFADEFYEPTVLPANYPNLLVNGSTGISAGYATNIPPHNLGEVIDATIKRMDSPNCRLETILDIVKGPDFPTGGVVEGREGLLKAYQSGRGKVVVKAKIEIVKEQGREKIIIHEIPYEVIKENLVKKIEDIRIDKKIEGIQEVIDESGREYLARITIELKKDANSDLILNYLLKNTELQVNYNFNMVAIVNRRPKLVGIMEVLDAFIVHQKEVVLRRTKFDLAAAERDLHIIDGLVRAMSILDEIIKIIRASKNKADSKENLMKKYEFSELQAEAIVTMQLYKLSNTDVTILLENKERLEKLCAIWKKIIENDDALCHVVKKELAIVKKEFADPRRTEIKDEVTEVKVDMNEMIPRENTVVVITSEGYVKRSSLKSYNKDEPTGLKPGDYLLGLFECTTKDYLMVFTNLGNYLFLPVHKIPDLKWKDLGKHVNNLVTLKPEEKVIQAYIFEKDKIIVTVSKQGMIKKSKMEDYEVTRYSKTMGAMKIKENDEVASVFLNEEDLCIISENGNYCLFNTLEVPITGVKSGGVKGINLKDDVVISGFGMKGEYVNIFTNKNSAKRVKSLDLAFTGRAKRGSTILKKVKSVDYKIINAFNTQARDMIGIKVDVDVKALKNSEIPIMDTMSTGSILTKKNVDAYFVQTEITSYLDKPEVKTEEQISMHEFIEDFKL